MIRSLWMLAAALSFALMGAMVKLSSDEGIATGKLIFFRCALSLVVFYLLMRWKNIPLRSPNWPAHLRRSVFSTLGLWTYFTAISLLPLALAVTLNYTSPLFQVLFLILMGQYRVRPASVLALAIGLTGVAVLLQPQLGQQYYLGAAVALSSAVFGALGIVSMRQLGTMGESPWSTVFYFTLFTTLFALPVFLTLDPFAPLTGVQMVYLCLIGLFATGGQIMMTLAYQQGEPLVAASLGYTKVIFAAVIGIFLWGEHLTPTMVIGIVTIIGGGLLTAWIQHQQRERLAVAEGRA